MNALMRLTAMGALVAVATPVFAKPMAAASYTTALANAARPDKDKARDAMRRPEIVLAFMNVKPGQKIGDFVTGGGYFSRILAGAVGPTGKIFAFQPTEFTQFSPEYAKVPDGLHAAFPNITPVVSPFAAPAYPEPLDTIVTIQNFHDLYLKPFPAGTGAGAAAALYKALKPGGVLIVVDHVALAGSGMDVPDTLHRITPEAVIAELTKAGFKLDGRSNAYANATDAHTANVFDPAIRGKTDQFMLRFRKRR